MTWKIRETGTGDNLLYSQAGTPSLDLRFATEKSLDDYVSASNLITFTRASTGTYVDSSGVIQTAAINAPRFDHDPSTLESLGLLVEESRTNLETYSEEFTDSSWSKTDTSVSANSIVSPDGSLNGTKVVENTNNGVHGLYQNFSGAFTSGVTYIHSVFAKAAERTTLQLSSSQGSDYANFNLSTGAITFATAGSNASIVALSNGWYRCSASFTPINVALVRPYIFAYDTDNPGRLSSYTGDGTSGIYIWGAQLEEGTFPTSYIPTSGSALPRAADEASITGTNFSSWYNQGAGTVFTEAKAADSGGPQYLLHVYGASPSDNRGAYYLNNNNRPSGYWVNSGSSQALLQNSTPVNGFEGASFKYVAAYDTDDFVLGYDGGNLIFDTSGTPDPTLDKASIGSYNASASHLNGHISRLTYWPTRLSDATLQTITT